MKKLKKKTTKQPNHNNSNLQEKKVYVYVFEKNIYIYTHTHIHIHIVIAVVQLLSHAWLFRNRMDCSPPGSSIYGVFQARILEWVAISFSRGSSQTRDQAHVSCIGSWILYHWPTREAHIYIYTHMYGLFSFMRLLKSEMWSWSFKNYNVWYCNIVRNTWDFPGSTVVKTFNVGCMGSIPS